VTVTSAQ